MARKRAAIKEPTPAPALLTAPREQVAEELDHRIQVGEGFLSRLLSNEAELDASRDDYSTWSDFNRELLRRRFTTSEVSDDYSASVGVGFFALGPQPLHERIEEYRQDVGFKLRRLRSIRERLPLFEEAQTVVRQRAIGGPKSRALSFDSSATFADREAPSSAPIGEDVPIGLRGALIEFLVGFGIVDSDDIWRLLRTHYGWGSWQDANADFEGRYGASEAQPFHDTLYEAVRARGWGKNAAGAVPALLAVPTPFFLTAMELAIAEMRSEAQSGTGMHFNPDPRIHVNAVFARRGVSYHLNDDDLFEWVGDRETYRRTVAPARSALQDERLAGARSEFEDALAKRRTGTPKDLEDAIDEAAKAVESAMEVVLDAHSIPLPPKSKKTAEPLWTALRDGKIVPTPTKDAILAPSRLRNVFSGHGTGASPRVVPDDTPDLAIQAASAALTYLARRLP